MGKRKEAVIYAYDNELLQIRPLFEGQTVNKEEALAAFMSHPLMLEGPKDEPSKGQAEVIAEAKKTDENKTTGTKDEEGSSRTYSLTYFNPETEKAEVIEAKVDIKMTDYATRMIEESVGIGSVYPLYAFIATPMIRTEVLPWRLKEILDEREYATPPPSGGASAVRVPGQAKQSEVVALTKLEVAARDAVVEALVRKENSEARLNSEIAVFENVVAAIRKGADPGSALGSLPPLSRARYLAALRRKRLEKKEVLGLLMRDLRLLKSIRKKLETLTVDGLLGLVKAMKRIKK
jgi:hypothetical protein